ncbi:uncharacterized protein LOC143745599 isoform X2 [Siphateles boraxobius]|uniref:uncharacterized protein LOC143745599 isoform X2 n=1 Tax=Siphateles boraxobius TaxID=180520 RepID=UPI004063FB25
MKYLVDKHREELCNKHVKGQSAWIRDFLAEYAESFPQLSSVLEANIHQCAYEQKGLENHTFQEMWDLYNQHSVQKARQEDLSLSERDLVRKAFSSVSRWLDTPVTNITSVQLKRFRKFVYDKNNQKSSSSINDPSWLDGTHLLEVPVTARVGRLVSLMSGLRKPVESFLQELKSSLGEDIHEDETALQASTDWLTSL